MDIPATTKITYTKSKAGKTFTEYKLNETGNYPKLVRISQDKEQYLLSVKQGNKWVKSPMHTTEHFDFYGVSIPYKGQEIILVISFKPSYSTLETRVLDGVSLERGNMLELNELINLIIYQF